MDFLFNPRYLQAWRYSNLEILVSNLEILKPKDTQAYRYSNLEIILKPRDTPQNQRYSSNLEILLKPGDTPQT